MTNRIKFIKVHETFDTIYYRHNSEGADATTTEFSITITEDAQVIVRPAMSIPKAIRYIVTDKVLKHAQIKLKEIIQLIELDYAVPAH